MNENRKLGWYSLAGLVILILSTWVRYWFILSGQLGLSPDEAQYWDWSRTWQWSYYSKGPLIAYLNALGTALVGPTELGVRLGALVGGVLMQMVVFVWIAVGWQRARTAFWTLVILNTTILFMAGGLLMTTDNPLLLCWIVGVMALSCSVHRGSWPCFILMGLSLTLGIMAKYTMLMFIPLALLAVGWISRGQELAPGYWSRLVKTLGLGGFLGFLPIVFWNAGHQWVGFKHVLFRGAVVGDKAQVFWTWKYFPEYLGGQLGVLTPWWFFFILLGAGLVTAQLIKKSDQPPFPWLQRSHAIILVVFFWPVWLFFLFWSLHAKVEANWSAVAYPTGIILAALAWERFFHQEQRPKGALIWPGLALLVFVVLHLQAFIPWDGRKNPMYRLRGWQELGLKIEEIMDQEWGGDQSSFVFSNQYGVTAALSFYVPGQKRAFCLPGDRKMNQYDLWPGPHEEWENAIFVLKGERTTLSPAVEDLFTIIDDPRVMTTQQGPRQGQTFTLFLCRGFKGHWPSYTGASF